MNIAKIFAYKILASENPILTPKMRAKNRDIANKKLGAINTICGIVQYYFENDKPVYEAVKWAAMHKLDAGSQIALPPLFPEEKNLPGSLRRRARDNGGYGAYLLNKLADFIIESNDKHMYSLAEKAELWSIIFPLLWIRLDETYTDELAAMVATNAAVDDRELILIATKEN